MSRIGKQPVVIPEGVTVDIAEGNVVHAKGPKGELTKTMHPDMILSMENGEITVATPENQEKAYGPLWGLTRSLVNNMVQGVHDGYSKTLILKGVGYRALVNGNKLTLNVGYSHPVEMEAPQGITIEAPEATKVVVSGADKELVGDVAADIRAVRLPEPYKGKGIRYENEHIKLKAGKTGTK
ncbi:MAG: 50S ribosomal protein L6 [Clostridiales bacterium]|uniref:Large ribosomal subunit protein uL6 n=1 Tax=Peptococcus niger TaxID=2741 RepID=A0A1G6TE41_PEPNI|nr:50S ribosomal protein L6 [Peptococcus niger]MDU1028813.1 50S ribosomal protein L6 [Clostridiales bacterium]MDU7504867.1 50S ribosomal protein L6 [Clostridia bacterium]MDU2293419.1 50S ribosomal protein L6 [Peptococcus niger]MDU5952808.1 50S ribosomal protein L6 [Clostridiales bacterium]MDU7244659.1 50S ribosomal protein L6 [Clostridiales bacterium]